MSSPENTRYPLPRKRGGRRQHKDFSRGVVAEAKKLMPTVSNTHAVLDSRKGFWECKDLNLTYDTKTDDVVLTPVRDVSITHKSFMRNFPSKPIKGIVLKNAQLDKNTGEMIEGSDIKVTKMSDTTLLIRGLPEQMPIFKRETSVSKKIRVDQDAALVRPRFNPNENPKVEFDPDSPEHVPSGRIKVSRKGVKLLTNSTHDE